ncbi:MAG: LysM peptidoglycan-binding domain-containing protein [Aquamicrobium sp.]|uniref:LysM peptidoglycan-binding domain-containing protein n=1 Tax=Aquamicrobium sp. TaxID=1872579 RepID=UPI00349EC9D4|nr:LysM peptidoglycan-binding domain-containing protein [Aquamicrobium sp.]
MRRALVPACFLLAVLAAGLTIIGLTTTRAEAACPARLGVDFGDTLISIARTCGISIETLRAANPGLNANTLRAGMVITVPRPALPSPQQPIGRPSVRIAPPLVPPATAVSPPTLTAPPPALRHPQEPRGFDVRPKHMQPRTPYPPFEPFPHQRN